jgi:hypothetical protein
MSYQAFYNDPRKLSKACFIASQRMESARKARVRFLMQYAGRFFGHKKDGSDEDRKASPVNMIWEGITTYVPNLVFSDPAVKVRTQNLLYRPYSDKLELATNHAIRDQLKLGRTLRKVVTDSLVLAGYLKTGIYDAGQSITIAGEQQKLGTIYADRVDPDDMIIDPMARDWDEMCLVGNRYRVPRDTITQLGFPESLVKQMTSRYDSQARNTDAASISDGKDIPGMYREVMEFVDLMDIFLPGDGVLITLPWTPDGSWTDNYLNVVEYDGPESGPYHQLGYQFAGDSVLPIAPVGIWYDLHTLMSRAVRKVARQAERGKKVLAYEGSAANDATEIANADDGEAVRVDNIDAMKEVEFGGASDRGLEYVSWLRGWFNEMAGNVDALAGNGDGAESATASQNMNSNQQVRLADSQRLVYNFTADVCKDVAYYIHTDPLIELPLIQRVNGRDQQVVYSPDDRMGEWFDYNISVKPYSMQRMDPQEKVRRTMEFATSVIPAAAQAYQTLGPAFKIQEFIVRIAQEIGIEDLDEIIDVPMLQNLIAQSLQQIPPPPKVLASMQGGGMQGPMQPNQPNPAQMGPAGATGGQETRQQQQQGAAPAQQQLANRQVGAVGA